jgi:hypothetical protein
MSYTGTNQLTTVPASITFGAAEQWTVGIDCTQQLSAYTSGTAPTSPAVVLADARTGAVVTLPDAPSVTGNIVSQHIAKSHVTAGRLYQLTLTYTPSGTTDVLEAILIVGVPSNS